MKYLVEEIVIVLLYCSLFDETWGHGMMLNPAGRASRWRFDPSAQPNYDDNGLNCGGYGVQYDKNNGNCGLCGDNYADATPRAHELGGSYGGRGVIVKTYKKNQIIDSDFTLTQNHLGYTYFQICNVDKYKKESEECFSQYNLKYDDGSDRFHVGNKTGSFNVRLKLPNDVTCKHCVLRWIYFSGNNWHVCEDSERGEGALGCGKQETFMSCADIRIQ